MSVSEILRSYKQKKGVNNQWIADTAGVSRGTVDRLLAGGSKSPRYDTLSSIAAALECPMSVLEGVYVAPPEPVPDWSPDAPEDDSKQGSDGRFYAMVCSYEDRLATLSEQYEARLASQERAHTECTAALTMSYEGRLRYMRKTLMIVGIFCMILLVGVVIFTVIDLLNRQVGWIRDARHSGYTVKRTACIIRNLHTQRRL